MANLQINASLNINKTLANIINDISKINPQIQSNDKARVKLIGSLDISKTIKTINANLQNINKDLKVQIGNVSFAPINTAQLQNNINQATQNVKPTVEVKPVVNTEGFKFSNKELREAIQEFNDGANVIEAFRKQFEKFGVSISSVQNLSTTNGELQGFIATVKSASGEVEKFKYELNADDNKFHLTNVTAADTAVQKLIERTIQWQNKTSAASKDAIASLDGVKTAWENANGGKYVQSNSYRTALTEQYNEAIKKAQELANADNTTFGGLKTEVDTAIKSLSRLVAEYHDAEKVATTLRAKDYTTVLNNTDSNIKGFEADVNRVKPLVGLLSENVQKLKDDIKTLRESTAEQHVKTSTLKGLLNDLDNAERRFQSFKKLFQDFGKADWYSSNKGLIDSLPDNDKVKVYQEYIKSLRESIKSFRDEWKQVGNTTGLKSISAEFGKLSSQLRDNLKPNTLDGWVKRFAELIDKADQVKQHLDKQVIVQKEIYELQGQINRLNVNPDAHKTELSDLQKKLNMRQQELIDLQTLSNVYGKLLPREQEEAYLLQQTTAEREKLNQIQNQSADKITVQNTANLKAYVSEIDTAITKLQGLSNQPVFGVNANNAQIQTTKTYIQSLTTEYEKLKQSLNGNLTADQLSQVKTRLAELDAQLKKAETDVKQLKASFKSDKDAQKLAGDISILTAQIKKFRAQNTRSEGRFGAEYQALLDKLKQRPDTAGLYAIRQEFRKLQGDVRAAGLTGMTFFDTFKNNFRKMSSWLGVSSLGMLVGREIRSMFSEVIKLDEALVDLKKTFQGTSQDLQEFYHESNNIAKQLGVTTEEVITQASSWSRLGYNTKETAIEMAKLSSEMALISPGLSTDEAQSGLVSVMKARKFCLYVQKCA